MKEFRISDFLSLRRILYWRWKVWRSQYYPPAKLQALQWKLLSKLLDHCFANVPYYRRLFTDLGLRRSDFRSLDDLSLLPVMSKDVLLRRHDEFRADNVERYKPREIPTSGTTGTPLRVYWDRDSNVLELTCQWRHFSWIGYRLGQSFLDIRSVILDDAKGYKWNWKCRGLEFSSDIIDESNIGEYAALVRRYRVKLWRGHPSAISSFCRLLKEAGIDDVKPKCVVTVSEALLPYQRELIESWTGVTVCDNYGLHEHNALICQCPEGGYHIASEYGIVEIIKDNGEPAQSGEEGRIVATGLHNKAFPLLRYDTRDCATVSDKVCGCGRTLPLVENLTGRIDDRVMTADGRWVSGLHFAFFFAGAVEMSQVVQRERDALDVYLVPTDDYDDETDVHLTDILKKKLGRSMGVRIHHVKEVPFPSPGKFKFVINMLGETPDSQGV